MQLYNKKEQKQLKELLYRLYPGLDDFKANTMTPAIFKKGEDNETIVTLLMYGDDTVQFKGRNTKGIDIDLDVGLAPNKNKVGRDLVIRVEITHKLGHPVFCSFVYGHEPLAQKGFIQALKEVNELNLWIVTYPKKKILSVVTVDFNYEDYKDELDDLLNS